jgi:hypothetical protein
MGKEEEVEEVHPVRRKVLPPRMIGYLKLRAVVKLLSRWN